MMLISNKKRSNSGEEKIVSDPPSHTDNFPCDPYNPCTSSTLEVVSLSLRSLSKRIELGALLSSYNIDIVLGCECHIDQSLLSSEILLKNYKIVKL